MAERAGQADHAEGGEDAPGGLNGPEGSDPKEDAIQQKEECPGCQSPGVSTLPCGHKLCPACVELSQAELGQAGCTICYGSRLMDSVLRGLLDALFHGQPRRLELMPGGAEEGGGRAPGGGGAAGELCVQHGEALAGFCLQEEEPLCRQCEADEHEGHQCCSVEEAVHNCKRELRSAIRSLQEQQETLTSIRQNWEDTTAHIKSQSIQTAQILREEFERMHQYLNDEEAALMAHLKQEEEEKSQKMKDKIDRINNDIQVLANSIKETEDTMGLDDLLFLKNYKMTSERAQCRVEEPVEESQTLIDVAKHQSCVQHHVWDKMLTIIQYFPVTMDPNTGSVCLGVSPDLSSVYVCEEQPLPDNEERFVSPPGILGSESFSSGRHSWEVEVGDNSHWSLGVASETVHRKDWPKPDRSPSPAFDSNIESAGGLWTVSLSSGEYRAFPDNSAPLRPRRRPRRVRIQLDWERGSLTFSDANDNTLIYRFKKQWSGTLRPYFSTTCAKHPLKVTAGRVTVTIE